MEDLFEELRQLGNGPLPYEGHPADEIFKAYLQGRLPERLRIHVRAYLAALSALVLIVLLVALIPVAGPGADSDSGSRFSPSIAWVEPQGTGPLWFDVLLWGIKVMIPWGILLYLHDRLVERSSED
jgi:hypothetical protein